MGFCQVPKIQAGSKNTEQGEIQIYSKNADALILGDATHEGGDISVYRDTSGNKQLSLDADAPSNAIALSVYGGVIAQNYLTVGQTTLSSSYPLYVKGHSFFEGNLVTAGYFYVPDGKGLWSGTANTGSIRTNISITSPNATDHAIKLQIGANDIIVAQATGDGAGGITNKAIGLYGTTPATQHAAIADATDAATAITQLNLALASLRAIGLIAT